MKIEHLSFIAGSLLIVLAAAAGLYLGLWWAFIGGIIQAFGGLMALSPAPLAIGLLKVVFSAVIGRGSFYVLLIPGLALITKGLD